MEEKIDEANKKFHELWKLTTKQDRLQLSIPKINQSVADGLAMIDHANAIILEVSQWKGNIIPMVDYGYLAEKINSLNKDWEWMQRHYEMRNTNPDYVFNGMDFDKHEWVLEKVI